jgi:hypothetical protein
MNHSFTRTSRSEIDRPMFSLRRLGVALLAVAGTAMAQTPAPVGTSTPAEYDCNGLEGVALTSCRQLNAAAVGGALVNPSASPTHDCAGMSGATFATCRDLNGQLAVPAPGAYGAGGIVNGGGVMTTTPATAPPGTSTVTQPTPGSALPPAQGTATPLVQQTTGGTNAITPSGTGAAATIESLPPANSGPSIAPGNGKVSPPTDRIVPMSSGTPSAAPASSGSATTGAAKAGK